MDYLLKLHNDEKNNKYVYDFEKNVFKYDGSDELAPPAIQKKRKDKEIEMGINKGLRFLGE